MSNYINNEDFLNAMIEYKKEIALAKENDKPSPPVPDYIGECFLLIAERLSYRPTVSYTHLTLPTICSV